MIIFPAIDVKDGQCVRLVKGEFSTITRVAKSINNAVQNFKSAGTVWLHTVDLDGASTGRQINAQIILDAVKNSGLKVQLGGGIRDLQTIEFLLAGGVDRVILGSAAIENPSLVREAVAKFGSQIAVGIDADKRLVATQGWRVKSSTDFITLAQKMEDMGVKVIIFTDIQRDGTLTGPSIDLLFELSKSISCKIVASGGITTIDDIKKLHSLGLYGAICGKSLYAGTLNLEEAIRIGGDQYAG
jgi:phosphoribosylformimino-5-aminoimidazole carboxamide ribotide isomerase